MKILVIGGSSLLGRALIETLPSEHQLWSTWNSNKANCDYQLDITDALAVNRVFERIKPDVVINCAGITSVDFAQNNQDAAQFVNVYGVDNLLKAATLYKSYFINLSTNAIFDGFNPPYTELSKPSPINWYGDTKLQADKKVWTYKYDFLNLRPILLYGWPQKNGRGNWVTTLLDNYHADKLTKAVTDVFYQPVYSIDFAKIIWKLIELHPENGDYHIASHPKMSLYTFLLMVIGTWKLEGCKLEQCSIDDFKNLAPRPKDTSFDTEKLNKLGIYCLPVEEGLALMRRDFIG